LRSCPPASTPFPYTTLFRSALEDESSGVPVASLTGAIGLFSLLTAGSAAAHWYPLTFTLVAWAVYAAGFLWRRAERQAWKGMHRDRKSTRLNSSHEWSSYAV